MDSLLNPFYIALYPEIHYTFDLFFNHLRHNQPEVFVDVPWRIDPGKSIPILCLIKHADRFPVTLRSITVRIEYADGHSEEEEIWHTAAPLKDYLWFRLFELTPRDGTTGDILLTARIELARGRRDVCIINHNYRGLSHQPLRIHIARGPLPSLPGWMSGEPHCHSFHSDDQIEFGAPVSATAAMARAIGLGWMALTDHSYDLDDPFGRVLDSDTTLSKWNTLKEDVEEENRKGDLTVLLGEEISCGNARNKNIHVLAYGISRFIPGCGDGAERWFQTRPDLSLREVLNRIRTDGGIAYAAHPEDRFSPAERVLLRRGFWGQADYRLPGYSGLQIWNGKRNPAFRKGYRRWIEMLLEGQRLFIMGGNDSHGDFNLFRGIRIPLLKMTESPERVFGKVRTCLLCGEKPDQTSVLRALRDGNSIVTSGPFIACTVTNEAGRTADIGRTISGRLMHLRITARSTEEFGALRHITLYRGYLTSRIEEKQVFRPGADFHDAFTVDMKDFPLTVDGPMYIRCETVSVKEKDTYHAYSNPIWLDTENRQD